MALPPGRPTRKSKLAAMEGLHSMAHPRRRQAHNADADPESDPIDQDIQDSESDEEQEPKAPAPRGRGRPRLEPGEGSTVKRGRKPAGASGGGQSAPRVPVRRRPVVTEEQNDPVTPVPQPEPDGSLFQIVKAGKMALTSVVDDWIEGYKTDRDQALLDLIQFFISCSGCRGRITPYMHQSMEHAEIIRKMTEEFDEESGDYPLIMTGPAWKKFRSNFCEFVTTLVRQCQYSIIYDQYMMDNVISLLTGLTDSQVRAFRHTSTLAAMKLMTALVDVALNLSVALDHTQRQYEAERAKSKGRQASERLEGLMDKRKEIEENQEEIRHMLTYIFKGVFVHRYRDSQPDIRSICTSEIGVWMKRYPSMFLDDSYLKYIGWTLYDRVGEVRLCCLKCLQPLYVTDELTPKLELFTNRFKDRIVEMTLDKEYDVAVQAVKLVISIFKFSENVLAPKDCENVYELVYSSHRGVAQAAGEFLNVKLFSREPDAAMLAKQSKKGKKRGPNTANMRDLIFFFIESELHEHGAYLVDSLWEVNPMLKDWECMTDLLLEEPGDDEDALDDKQESCLIEIMVCCVKQAATGEYPVGRGTAARKVTTKETKQVQEDKRGLTDHFIVTLPKLLAKFDADAEKAANLLNIPLYFELENYTTGRNESYLDSLLLNLQHIVEKHAEPEVLEGVSKVLEVFTNETYSICSKCNVFKETLLDKICHTFTEAFENFSKSVSECRPKNQIEARVKAWAACGKSAADGVHATYVTGDAGEPENYALRASLCRVYAFFCCHDLNKWGLWKNLFDIIVSRNDVVENEIRCKALTCCHMSILWQMSDLGTKSPPDEAALKVVKKQMKNFINQCALLLNYPATSVQEEAYVSICDLLIVFSKDIATRDANLEPLVFVADSTLQTKLSTFLNEKVFIEDEDESMDENRKIEELHKRRNFLAAFCKLIVYNIIKIKSAADMFKYYMKFYNDYGDIIKATLAKAREINKVHTAKTLATSLIQLYKMLASEQPTIDHNTEGFLSIKELARRFSLSFGLDLIKNREAVAAMHKEGILFVFNGFEADGGGVKNLPFLNILCEFSSKLMKQDKKVVLGYLDSHMRNHLEKFGEYDTSYRSYRNSLMISGDGDSSVGQVKPVSTGKRGRGAKRKLPVEDVEPMEISRPGGRTPARDMVEPLTSTIVKRSRGRGAAAVVEQEESVAEDLAQQQDAEPQSEDAASNYESTLDDVTIRESWFGGRASSHRSFGAHTSSKKAIIRNQIRECDSPPQNNVQEESKGANDDDSDYVIEEFTESMIQQKETHVDKFEANNGGKDKESSACSTEKNSSIEVSASKHVSVPIRSCSYEKSQMKVGKKTMLSLSNSGKNTAKVTEPTEKGMQDIVPDSYSQGNSCNRASARSDGQNKNIPLLSGTQNNPIDQSDMIISPSQKVSVSCVADKKVIKKEVCSREKTTRKDPPSKIARKGAAPATIGTTDIEPCVAQAEVMSKHREESQIGHGNTEPTQASSTDRSCEASGRIHRILSSLNQKLNTAVTRRNSLRRSTHRESIIEEIREDGETENEDVDLPSQATRASIECERVKYIKLGDDEDSKFSDDNEIQRQEEDAEQHCDDCENSSSLNDDNDEYADNVESSADNENESEDEEKEKEDEDKDVNGEINDTEQLSDQSELEEEEEEADGELVESMLMQNTFQRISFGSSQASNVFSCSQASNFVNRGMDDESSVNSWESELVTN